MPWQPQNLMNQRLEFALKALRTENFRALCREYGISPEVVTNGEIGSCKTELKDSVS